MANRGRPVGRNMIPLVTTIPRALMEALKTIRRQQGVPYSHTVTMALEQYFKSQNVSTAIQF
jgi:hypothetical protein